MTEHSTSSGTLGQDGDPIPTGRQDATLAPEEIACRLADWDRLRAVAGIDLANPDLRARLNEICARTAQRLEHPMSMVTLLLDSAQFIVGSAGLDGWVAAIEGTPAEWSFCQHPVSLGSDFVVSDAAEHPTLANSPLVTHVGIGAYAGVPLVTGDGQVVGAHCVKDTSARDVSEEELAQLAEAAQEIVALLEEFRREPHSA